MSGVRTRIHHAAMRIFADKGGSAISVSELAAEAGIARGTIYNNIEDPGALFDAVCQMVADELHDSVLASFSGVDDPAHRFFNITRLCVLRVHEEPKWGRFIACFAMAEPRIGAFWGTLPADELRRGLIMNRFVFEREQVSSITASAGGATFGAMTLVLGGHRTWRQAGSDTAEFMLRAIGVQRHEARELASREIDALPEISMFVAA